MSKLKSAIAYIILFNLCGTTYYGVEMLYRGYSHISMWMLAGMLGILIGLINQHKLTWDMPLWKQLLIGECIVLPLEFITGLIVNVWLQLNVWNYSGLWLSEYFLNQSSPLFALLFAPLILLAIFIDDWYRYLFMDGRKPKYKIF
jgi:hypothetical protein